MSEFTSRIGVTECFFHFDGVESNESGRKVPDAIRKESAFSFRDRPDGIPGGKKVYDYTTLLIKVGTDLDIGKGKQMTAKITPDLISSLRRELQTVRQQSLLATRQGDFMKVARLTAHAARLNKSIMDAEGELLAQA